MPGPYDGGHLVSEDIDMLYSTEYEVGQMRAGNAIGFHRVSLPNAIANTRRVQEFPTFVDHRCRGTATFEDAFPPRYLGLPPSVETGTWGSAIIHQMQEREASHWYPTANAGTTSSSMTTAMVHSTSITTAAP